MSCRVPRNEAPVFQLNPADIGLCLVDALAISGQLGHKHVLSTLRDYASDDDGASAAAEFVRDVITGTTPEAVKKWFGGTCHASAWMLRKAGV